MSKRMNDLQYTITDREQNKREITKETINTHENLGKELETEEEVKEALSTKIDNFLSESQVFN